MSKTKNMSFQLLTLTTLSSLFFVSCAKEKAFDTQYREERLDSRDLIQISEQVLDKSGNKISKPVEYVYVPMTLSTPMNVVEAAPFYQGDEKVVRLQWSEQGLEVLEIERDARFAENDENSFPVLVIPAEYKSFRCREDAYGDCTNVEEINTELEWHQNKFFKPNFEQLKVKELNMLDLATLAADSCISPKETKLVDYELSEGVIYIELEKSYQFNSDFSCVWNNYVNDRLSNNGFKVRHSYSLVRLDKLASKNYETVHYPVPEHDRFGYFTRERKVLKDDFDSSRRDHEIFMERWNPKKDNGTIKYYLSSAYSKPENKTVLNATYEAIATMNKEMSEGGVPLNIKLIEQPDPKTEVSAGDLRYSTIVLIEDPLANGLLGYGPAVSNPYTGEIIQAHTNMYLGVLKSMTRRVYNNARDLVKEQLSAGVESKVINNIKVSPEAIKNLPSVLVQKHIDHNHAHNHGTEQLKQVTQNAEDSMPIQIAKTSSHQDILSNINLGQLEKAHKNHTSRQVNLRMQSALQYLDQGQFDSQDLAKMTRNEKEAAKSDARLNYFAENNAYAVEFFSVGGTSKVVFPSLKEYKEIWNSDDTLKTWESLTKEQKAIVQDIILVQTYKSTLIHEIGHNLGLRHNFRGSTDKENFFTDTEAKALGMPAAPAYSSIMDYGFSEYNELKALGKYDVAALRYGYARELELDNGTFAKVQTDVKSLEDKVASEGLKFKNYAFCTDGHAGLSAFCNRFDEGTTILEITKHHIERYNTLYEKLNFRDQRLEFNSYGIVNYHSYINRSLSRVRDIIEEYEFYAGYYGPELMEQGCSPQDSEQYPGPCGQIGDYRSAVILAGDPLH